MENEATCVIEQAKGHGCEFFIRNHKDWNEVCTSFTCEGETVTFLDVRKIIPQRKTWSKRHSDGRKQDRTS